MLLQCMKPLLDEQKDAMALLNSPSSSNDSQQSTSLGFLELHACALKLTVSAGMTSPNSMGTSTSTGSGNKNSKDSKKGSRDSKDSRVCCIHQLVMCQLFDAVVYQEAQRSQGAMAYEAEGEAHA